MNNIHFNEDTVKPATIQKSDDQTTTIVDIQNFDENQDENITDKIKICIHICEKKKRRCKFNAIRNSNYCVEHLPINQQVIKLIIV